MNFPVMQDIKTKVYGAKKGNLEDPSRLGNVMYMRGVSYGIILVEALRVATKFGKGKVVTPTHWGFEHLNLTEARIKELRRGGTLPADQDELPHRRPRGSGMVLMWDGTGFSMTHHGWRSRPRCPARSSRG